MGYLICCSVCGGNKVEHDSASGSSFCVVCGAVLEENTIVSELTFGETDSGQAILHGQFVSDKGVASTSYGGPGQIARRLTATESREITLANARRRIQQLAAAVNLSDQYVDMAHRWFILALQHNFTRGRRGNSVSAACLYIVCRREKTSHMLLDFSEVLRVNVFVLGNIFLKLVRLLNLDLPLVDPSLYMGRFAARLEFGEKTQHVANTALRISARMRRDWIQTGRKPSGICGACLLVSSRLYGFYRTQAEIIEVVKVCESTIRKRLLEFVELPSSKLTPQEFHNIWLEHEVDPPVFTQHKLAAAEHEAAATAETKTWKPAQYVDFTPVSTDFESSQDEEDLEGEMSAVLKEAEDAAKPLETHLRDESFKEVSLSDLDEDEEVLNALVHESEFDLKSKIWNALNEEFVEEQRLKAKTKEAEMDNAAKLAQSGRPRKQAKKPKGDSSAGETTAYKAASTAINTKRISKKINYPAFEELFDPKKALLGLNNKTHLL